MDDKELLPCPFQIWDEVEVITGEGQPDWCSDWVNAPTLFVVGVDYNFRESCYELTVAENKEGQYLTDEMPADCVRLVYRATPQISELKQVREVLESIKNAKDAVFLEVQRQGPYGDKDGNLDSAIGFIYEANKTLSTLDGIIAGQDAPVPEGYKLVSSTEYQQLKNIQNAFQGLINLSEMNATTPAQPECPSCGGEADNGHDRCIPPNPYYCTRCEEVEALKAENEQLKAKLEKAKDALRFYGDKSEYRIQIIDDVPVCKITDDKGQRARTTLEEIK